VQPSWENGWIPKAKGNGSGSPASSRVSWLKREGGGGAAFKSFTGGEGKGKLIKGVATAGFTNSRLSYKIVGASFIDWAA